MNSTKSVLFEQALDIAVEQTRSVGADFADKIYLIRDLRGRIRVVLPGQRQNYSDSREIVLKNLSWGLSEGLGAYGFPPDQAVLFVGDLVGGVEMLGAADQRPLTKNDTQEILLLDRQIIGQDWTRKPLARKTTNSRATFFAIKGGVGRSTALVIWAWSLAKLGRKILIFDLDLESPGVSATLLPKESLPDHGIVDWFVEDGVGQVKCVENNMISLSPLAKYLDGEIKVIPAYGRDTGDYLSKLSRCYAEVPGENGQDWAERVQRLVETFEESERPDLVILDSRAGLHDIAAVLVTRMDAETFLFAVDSVQTWNAYSFLFRGWTNDPHIDPVRRRLQIVAGMVPETSREDHLRRFRENSWDLFREYLYDETDANELNAFSFDLDADDGPHNPIPVFWNRALQEFDPSRSESVIDERNALAAMGAFIDAANGLLFPYGDVK